jgi:hypothetical protein
MEQKMKFLVVLMAFMFSVFGFGTETQIFKKKDSYYVHIGDNYYRLPQDIVDDIPEDDFVIDVDEFDETTPVPEWDKELDGH